MGSQFKLQVFFDNDVRALFKPKRTEREQQAPPNQVHIAEYERHTSEIAAYHLDRFVKKKKINDSSQCNDCYYVLISIFTFR